MYRLVLLWLYATHVGKVHILERKNPKTSVAEEIKCDTLLSDNWWQIVGDARRPSSLRPTARCCLETLHRCFLPVCQPNPCGWILPPPPLTFLQTEEENLRKNGFLLLFNSKRSLPAPPHLLCIGRLPTQTKYCPHSNWRPGIKYQMLSPQSHPDIQDIELGGTTPLSQASKILRERGAQFTK